MATDKVKVLLIQDSPGDVLAIRHALSLADFEIDMSYARSVSEGMDFLLSQAFDVVLCDYHLPRMDGLAVVAEIRKMERAPAVILLTSSVDPELVAQAFRRGVDDYICNDHFSTQRLLQAIMNAVSRLRESERWFAEAELGNALSVTDPLTGVFNRRYLSASLQAECSRARRYQRPLSCMMVNLADLTTFSARHGPVALDEAIRNIAVALKDVCRGSDIVARFEGDEFCIVLPETPYEGASQVAARISDAIRSRQITLEGGERLVLTVSIGLFTAVDDGHLDADNIIESATRLLREAKVA